MTAVAPLIPAVASTKDQSLADAIRLKIAAKTKPAGSLGVLEALALQIALIQQTDQPRIDRPHMMVFAADHGVVAEGISAYPQSVTWQMVDNFLTGGAAINILARQEGWSVQIIDAGVQHDFGVRAGLTTRKIGPGTRNFLYEPAMSRAQAETALSAGCRLAEEAPGNTLGFGEMGIGNSTAAAAIMHRLTGYSVTACVGAGTGLTAEGIFHKQQVIERAMRHHGRIDEPMAVLATFGGFEIAMMAGAMLKGAQLRKVLLIDGFIATSALLVASALQRNVLDYCVFGHCSEERGHRLMLDFLGAAPLLQLGLRLGEGSGAALALPLVRAAANFLRDMASFDSAGVSRQSRS